MEFEDSRDAEDAVRALDGTRVCGTRIRVEMSSGRTRRDEGRRGERSERGERGERGGPRREERRGGGGRNRFERKSFTNVANTKFIYLTRNLKS